MLEIIDTVLHLIQQIYDQIANVAKTAEARINKPKYAELRVGDKIRFSPNERDNLVIEANITALKSYDNFRQMMSERGMLKRMQPEAISVDEAVSVCESFSDFKTGQNTYGVLAIEFEKIT